MSNCSMHRSLHADISVLSLFQGGVGKTTIAAALVHDEEVRQSFDRIVLVSVGQEPNVREFQESIHLQLTKQQLPDAAKNDAMVITALRDAAKGMKVLLVLDDVWDPKHEKPLNFIDDRRRQFFPSDIGYYRYFVLR